MGIGTFTIAELTAHSVTATIDLVRTPNNFLQYVLTAGRFRAVLPHCGCDRPACAGPGVWGRVCKRAEGKGADRFTHRRDLCHGGMSLWHEEHVMVYAAAVLATFGPKGRAKAKRNVGKSSYRPQDFMPLDGEQAVYTTATAGSDRWLVVCNAARCRNERSRTAEVSEATSRDEATRAREAHTEWHHQFGEHPRVALDRWIAVHANWTPPTHITCAVADCNAPATKGGIVGVQPNGASQSHAVYYACDAHGSSLASALEVWPRAVAAA